MKININKILIYVIVGLLAIILFCSVTAFIFGKAHIKNMYRHSDPVSVSQVKDLKNSLYEYKEIGTLRALTKPEDSEVSNGVNLVVTPWFAYEKSDSAFIEELSHKKKSINTVFLKYFASHTQSELFLLGEKKVKEQLVELINAELVMGKIKVIYFDDYIFLD